MAKRFIRQLSASLLTVLLAACGGGGGDGNGGGGGPGLPPPPAAFPSALDFNTPDSFLNGRSFATERTSISVSGELNSTFIPRGFCPDSQPPQNFSVSWSNAANGQSGSAPIAIGCVVVSGLSGIKSQFVVDAIALEHGNNRISFRTFEGTAQIGRDDIVIVREDTAPPQVTSTYPADGQEDVAIDHALVVVFNEPMNPATLTGDRFSVTDSMGVAVTGDIAYSEAGNAWTFRSTAPLGPDSTYTVTVNGAVEDANGGNALGDDVAWIFRTGTMADGDDPFVAKAWPGSHCDCAPATTRILAGFSEFVDPQSVSANSVSVSTSGVPVIGTTVYRGNFLEFVPGQDLVDGLTYTVSVSGGISDPAGRAMAIDYAWQFTTDNRQPVGSWSETSQDQPPPAMSNATAVWAGSEVLVWGPAGAGSFDPVANRWNVASDVGFGGPSSRFDHSAVWTGTEMIVWGGRNSIAADGEIFPGGGAFDTGLNRWRAITAPPSATSFPTFNHVAVWTGSEMIVWGGMADTGGPAREPVASGWRYAPGPDSAMPFTGDNAPSPRSAAAAVWTGSEMIVWGGFDASGAPLNDGARYDPSTDSWRPLPPVAEALVPGNAHSAVWTGTEMIVWNGGRTAADQTFNNRLREPTLHFYDPVADAWRVSASGWEPFLAGSDPLITSFSGSGYFAFWTGDRMFVAGRYPGDRSYLYDPAGDGWQPAASVLGMSRRGAAAAWAGDRFVIWGGAVGVLPGDDGLVFQP